MNARAGEPGELFPDPFRARKSRRKRGSGSASTRAEDLLAMQIAARALPPVAREWPFARAIGRRWRFDLAFLEPWRIGVEIEGLVVRRIQGELVVMGRHASITGFREDLRKYNTAARLGWTVLRFETGMVPSGEALECIERVLAARGFKGA